MINPSLPYLLFYVSGHLTQNLCSSLLSYFIHYLFNRYIEELTLSAHTSIIEYIMKEPLKLVVVVHQSRVLNFKPLRHTSTVKLVHAVSFRVFIALADLHTTGDKRRVRGDVNKSGHYLFPVVLVPSEHAGDSIRGRGCRHHGCPGPKNANASGSRRRVTPLGRSDPVLRFVR